MILVLRQLIRLLTQLKSVEILGYSVFECRRDFRLVLDAS